MVNPFKPEIIWRDVESVTPYVKNNKKHPTKQVDKIASSIAEFGWDQPIVVDGDGVIIKGHGRREAALRLNIKRIPVVVRTDLSPAQMKAARIADNRSAESEYDTQALGLEMQDLKALEFDLGLTGFDPDEIEALLNPEVEPEEGNGDPDDVPTDVETRCKPGDLWVLGNHRLLCGDSTNIQHMEKLMGGGMADCVWTDPPYNVAYEGKTEEALTIQNDKMSGEKFRQFLKDAFASMAMVTKAGGSFYIAHADSEGYNFRGAVHETGWLLKQCLVWVKNTFAMGRQDYHWQHEPILYGWKEGAAHKWHSDRKQSTVLNFDKPQRNGEHPTMKPVELVAYCLKNSTIPKNVVLDPFGGSGTTLIACETLRRQARLMELDPKYCDVILTRWEKFTSKTAVLQTEEAA